MSTKAEDIQKKTVQHTQSKKKEVQQLAPEQCVHQPKGKEYCI